MKSIEKFLLFLCSLFLISLILLFFYFYTPNWWKEFEQVNVLPTPNYTFLPNSTVPSTNNGPSVTSPTFSKPSDDIKQEQLFISKQRKRYKSGEMTLIIPSLNLNEKIQASTNQSALSLGPGLYEYAQLPTESKSNVSIAAHRNKSRNGIIKEWFFYYIDQLKEGNHLYIIYKNKIYEYAYYKTSIVTPEDWSPIYQKNFSCITLTSCEPIGIASHRIVIQGKLEKILDYSNDFQYKK